MIRFEKMTEAEFQDYVEQSIIRFAEGSPRYQDLARDVAIERTRKEIFTKILPEGFHSKGHILLTLFQESQRVGYLHLGEFPSPGSKVLHAWDFVIFEPYRGQGLGRAAMEKAGEYLKTLGYSRVTLNVFGDNQVARRLYEKMGFQVSQIQMSRNL